MSELFSESWMQGFQAKWNAEADLSGELEKIGFNSVIGYGFAGEDAPKGVLKVENGKAVAGGAYAGETLNWDIRCSEEQWKKMMADPPGMMGLGLAFTAGHMKFAVGDYGAMIKDPRMAGPFIKSFAVMAQV
ncbi:MAG: SCP-2 sterol transfer family protein [Gammaproteobacteria bacterium]|nr:SCP-2 sterol transfer family protein [Gammaproteobacteria bacterium]MBU1654647.1 SCP-2 sterol transfer family protein [Gammaproteobacteria bacterium]MBU1960440.1 SCP-2 sterol transfer family protein [Gammaproteobacteria bacterium]